MKTYGLLPAQVLASLTVDDEGHFVPPLEDGVIAVPLVKLPLPPLTETEAAKPVLMWFADRVERQWQVVAAQVKPAVVPFRALCFALQTASLYAAVKAAALSTDEGEIWWETAKSSTVARDHPFVTSIQSALGKSDAEIDAIFTAAKTLNV